MSAVGFGCHFDDVAGAEGGGGVCDEVVGWVGEVLEVANVSVRGVGRSGAMAWGGGDGL